MTFAAWPPALRSTPICLCGSLPAGAPADAPADLIASSQTCSGAQLWVDSSKAPLKNALAAKPYAIKVNREEIAEAAGASLSNSRSGGSWTWRASCSPRAFRIVVISLGAEGALLVADGLVAQATPPVIQSGGSGRQWRLPARRAWSAALADGADPLEALRRGVAAGTVNALYAGGAQFPYAHFLEILNQTRVASGPGMKRIGALQIR